MRRLRAVGKVYREVASGSKPTERSYAVGLKENAPEFRGRFDVRRTDYAAFCSVTCGCTVSTVVPILIVRGLAASGTS